MTELKGRRDMKSGRGFTLIEIVVTIGILGMVLSAAFGILHVSNSVQRKSISEFEVQAAVRAMTENVNRISRFSTAVFSVPKSSFREDNLTPGWSYIGILDDSIVLYEYGVRDGETGHFLTVIAQSDPNVDYNIMFKKVDDDFQEKIVGYTIQAFIHGRPVSLDENGEPVGHINIYSQAEALNSLQVIHKGTPLDPAVALAFRGDTRNAAEIEELKPVAQVAMVLDVSGSMNWQMNGSSTSNPRLRRIWFLKEAACELIEKFSASAYPVKIAMAPFSTHANNPRAFRDAKADEANLLTDINALVADGGTNTGDGIRRAYHMILEGRNNPEYAGKTVSDYLIILVDGVTTFATRTGTSQSDPFRTDGLNIPPPHDKQNGNYGSWWNPQVQGHVFGNGSELDPQGTAYVDLIGTLIKLDGKIKVFVIGFSSRSSDLESVDDIVEATGAEPKFLAGDIDELNVAFGEIHKIILNDLWYIDGPEF